MKLPKLSGGVDRVGGVNHATKKAWSAAVRLGWVYYVHGIPQSI